MNTSAFYMSMAASRWFAIYIDVIVAIFITAVAFFCVLTPGATFELKSVANSEKVNPLLCPCPWFTSQFSSQSSSLCTRVWRLPLLPSVSASISSGEVALMLVYAVQLTGFFSWIMRQSAELQNGVRAFASSSIFALSL